MTLPLLPTPYHRLRATRSSFFLASNRLSKILARMRISALAAIATSLLSFPLAAQGESRGSAAEVQACVARNIPHTTSEQMVQFVSVDRAGGRRSSRAKIMGKRFDDGLRRLLLRFTEPPELRRSALLVVETDYGPNQVFLYTSELERVKRVTAEGAAETLFGSDFSYADLERWLLLDKPGEARHLREEMLDGRPVHVVESRPDPASARAYETVVSYIDAETCVVLRTESYQPGGRLRKVLAAEPASIAERGAIRLATELRLEDLRDGTRTDVSIEDVRVDQPIEDGAFAVSRLSRRR